MVKLMKLHEAISIVCPFNDGVYIGNEDDKNTWGIHFTDGATEDMKSSAYAVITNWVDPVEVPVITYSKLKIERELLMNGTLPDFVQFLETFNPTDSLPVEQQNPKMAGAYGRLWNAATVISSDYPELLAVLPMVGSQIGLSQTEVDAILSRCMD